MTSRRKPRVAYYAHHHGTGHLRHAANIARLDAVDLLVTGTMPAAGVPDLPGGARFAPLPPDVARQGPFPPGPGTSLHYAPTVPAVRERFARLHAYWEEFMPDVVVVDVSVETAVFARLAGYPVIHRRMHGDRTDAPHRLAYDSVNGLIAYFPQTLETPEHLAAYGTKSTYLGMLAPRSAGRQAVQPRTVAVQTSLGGTGVRLPAVLEAARATPDWTWRIMGRTSGAVRDVPSNVELLGVVAEPAPLLAAAEVLVTSAGHNAVAAAAAARRPALLIPEQRPFREQERFAQALAGAGATAAPDFSAPTDWQRTLAALSASDPELLARTLLVSEAEFRSRFLTAVERATAESGAGERPPVPAFSRER